MILTRPDSDAPRPPLNAAAFKPELSTASGADLGDMVPPAKLDTRRERLTRIFQIGFNKCGTRSLYRFLQRSGIQAAHFNRGLLAWSIQDNIAHGRKPLAGRIDRYVAYTDIQQVTKEQAIEGVRYFRELYAYYPNSYFILNTRDKEAWLKSRLAHGAGFYARRYARALGVETEEEVVARWSAEWDRHHAEVKEFFADKPGRLLVYDIKNSKPQEMVDFLAPDFLTRVEDFRHEGDTAHVDPENYRGNRPVRHSADGSAKPPRRKKRAAKAGAEAPKAEGRKREGRKADGRKDAAKAGGRKRKDRAGPAAV